MDTNPLSFFIPSQRVIIRSMLLNSEVNTRLREMGLLENTILTIYFKSGNTFIIKSGRGTFILNKEVASQILVELF